MRYVEFGEQIFEQRFLIFLVQILRLNHGADIVLDIEAAEDRAFLRKIADAELGSAIHRECGDVLPVERDFTGVRIDQSRHDVERRRFPRAVRAEQGHGLAAVDGQRHIAQDGAFLVTFGQMGGHEAFGHFFKAGLGHLYGS